METILPILELITVSAKFLSKERSLYYINQAKRLQDKIHEVSDSEFYKKDMEAKGKAERELHDKTNELRLQFISEASVK